MTSNPSPKKIEGNNIPFIYPILETQSLPKPDQFPDISFVRVLDERRSERSFSELSKDNLSTALYLSAKVKNVLIQENGFVLSQRPTASAGARHPIDILVISPSLFSNNAIYYYNPFEHSLAKLNIDKNIFNDLKEHINSIVPVKNGTILWFVAHPNRTEAKYDHAISLIWRDAGALIHAVQLACHSLGINSCPVGSLGEPFITKMFSTFGKVFGVGGIIIG